MTKRKTYTDEFKREAVRLLATRGDRPAKQIADNHGVAESILYAWRRQYEDVAEQIRAERGETPEEELKRLRREVAQLKRDKEILAKACAIFAKEAP